MQNISPQYSSANLNYQLLMLPALKELLRSARKLNRNENRPKLYLSHAWPTTDIEQNQSPLSRLLWLSYYLDLAGIHVIHELDNMLLKNTPNHPCYSLAHAISDWKQFIEDTIQSNPKPNVWLLGSDSYYAATIKPNHQPYFSPLAYVQTVLERESIKAKPFLWAGEGSYSQSLPPAYQTAFILDIRTSENLLQHFPKLLSDILPYASNPVWTQAIKNYESEEKIIRKVLKETINDPKKIDTLQTQWQRYQSDFQQHSQAFLDRCPVALRALLDRAWLEERNQIAKQYVSFIQSKNLFSSINNPTEFTQPLPAIPNPGEILVLKQAHNTGKRNTMLALGQLTFTKLHTHLNKILDDPFLLDPLDLKSDLGQLPAFPIWLDLINHDNSTRDILCTVLTLQGFTRDQIAFIRQYQPLLLLIDRASEIIQNQNLYLKQKWSKWQIGVVYHFESQPRDKKPRLYCLPPSDQDHYLAANHPDGSPNFSALTYDTNIRRSNSHPALTFLNQRPSTKMNESDKKQDADFKEPSKDQLSLREIFIKSLEANQAKRKEARYYLQSQRYQPLLNDLGRELLTLAFNQVDSSMKTSPHHKQAFISYPWPKNKNQLRTLQSQLQQLVDDCRHIHFKVILDILELKPGQIPIGTNIQSFMEDGIKKSDFIFLIGSQALSKRVTFDHEGKPQTNIAFEFDQIRCKATEPGCVYRLSYEKNIFGKDVSNYPAFNWKADHHPEFDFSDQDLYYAQLPNLWASLLSLSNDPRAKNLIENYLSEIDFIQRHLYETDITQQIELSEKNAQQNEEEALARIKFAEKARDEFEAHLRTQLIHGATDHFKCLMKPLKMIKRLLKSHYVSAKGSDSNTNLTDNLQDLSSLFNYHSQKDTLFNSEEKNDPRVLNHIDVEITLLLGPAGSGKSVALQSHCYDACKQYKGSPQAYPLPIFIELSQYTQSRDQNDPWLQQAFSSLGLDQATIQKTPWLQVYCDGLDELILNQLTPNCFYESFSDLMGHSISTHHEGHRSRKLTLFVSCRQEKVPYLEKQLQKSLLNYLADGWIPAPKTNTLYISPFSPEQIKIYLDHLSQHAKIPWKDPINFYQTLQSIPGINELIKNPLTLSIVSQTLPNLPQKAHTRIKRIHIFQSFINQQLKKTLWQHLNHHDLKSLPFLPTERWRKQAHQIALMMLKRKQQQLQLEEAFANVDETERHLLREALPLYENNSVRPSVSFIHQSIQEYFVAEIYYQSLAMSIEHKQALAVSIKEWNALPSLHDQPGIIDFLKALLDESSQIQINTSLWKIIESTKQNPNHARAGSLAATLLNKLGENFADKDLSHTHLPNTDFSHALLAHTNFEYSVLSGSCFDHAFLDQTTFNHAKLDNTSFTDEEGWVACPGEKKIIWSPEKETFILMTPSKTILYNTAQQLPLLTKNHIDQVRYAPNGQTVAFSKKSVKISLFSSINGALLKKLPNKNLDRIVFAPNSQSVVFGGDYSLYSMLLSTSSGSVLKQIDVPYLDRIIFSPDSRTVAFGGHHNDQGSYLVRTADGMIYQLKKSSDLLQIIVFSPNSHTVLFGEQHQATLYRTDGTSLASFPIRQLKSILYAPNSEWFTLIGQNKICLYYSDGQPLRELAVKFLDKVIFSTDSQQLAAIGKYAAVMIHFSFNNFKVIEHDAKQLDQIYFSPDLKTLIAAGEESSLALMLSTDDGDCLKKIETNHIDLICYAPDSQTIVLTDKTEHSAALYCIQTGEILKHIQTNGRIHSIKYADNCQSIGLIGEEANYLLLSQSNEWRIEKLRYPYSGSRSSLILSPNQRYWAAFDLRCPTTCYDLQARNWTEFNLIAQMQFAPRHQTTDCYPIALLASRTGCYRLDNFDQPTLMLAPNGTVENLNYFFLKGRAVYTLYTNTGLYLAELANDYDDRKHNQLNEPEGLEQAATRLEILSEDILMTGSEVTHTKNVGNNKRVENRLVELCKWQFAYQKLTLIQRVFYDNSGIRFHWQKGKKSSICAVLEPTQITVVNLFDSLNKPLSQFEKKPEQTIIQFATDAGGNTMILESEAKGICSVQLRSIQYNRLLAQHEKLNHTPGIIQYAPDMRTVAYSDRFQHAYLWRCEDGHELALVNQSSLDKIIYAPDSKTILFGSSVAHTIRLQRIHDGHLLAAFHSLLYVIEYASNSETLSFGDNQGGMLVSTDNGRRLAKVGGSIVSIAYAKDDHTVAFGSHEKITLFRVSDGYQLKIIDAKNKIFNTLIYLSDEQTMIYFRKFQNNVTQHPSNHTAIIDPKNNNIACLAENLATDPWIDNHTCAALMITVSQIVYPLDLRKQPYQFTPWFHCKAAEKIHTLDDKTGSNQGRCLIQDSYVTYLCAFKSDSKTLQCRSGTLPVAINAFHYYQSLDQKYLVTACRDRTLRIWNVTYLKHITLLSCSAGSTGYFSQIQYQDSVGLNKAQLALLESKSSKPRTKENTYYFFKDTLKEEALTQQNQGNHSIKT